MCSQSCLCNSCYTKNNCSDCIYSEESPVSYCYFRIVIIQAFKNVLTIDRLVLNL